MKKRNETLSFIFIVLILCGCSLKPQQQVDLNIVAQHFLTDTLNETNSNCRFINDTIRNNINTDFYNSIFLLQNKFSAIDAVETNALTKQYVKSMLLAEFVYALFSYRLLGSTLGLGNDFVDIANWSNLPLETCYNIGNENNAPIWCGNRSTFYIRLLDSLLNIKAEQKDIRNIHSFPVVSIGHMQYIVDPYDPFIMVDTSTKTVIDYNSSKNMTGIICQRTKRTFGFAGELISPQFVSMLKLHKPSAGNICDLLQFYLASPPDSIMDYVEPCSIEKFHKTFDIHHVDGGKNSFIMIPKQVAQPLMNQNHFRKYYLGINCK